MVQTKPGLDNTRIINVNNMLANLALRKGCYFINIREALTKQDGSMIDEYDAQYDGVHFKPHRIPGMEPVSGHAYCLECPQRVYWPESVQDFGKLTGSLSHPLFTTKKKKQESCPFAAEMLRTGTIFRHNTDEMTENVEELHKSIKRLPKFLADYTRKTLKFPPETGNIVLV